MTQIAQNYTNETGRWSWEMSGVKEKKVVGVRLVDLMRETLSRKAEQNGRSLSGEIAYRLRKSLEEESGHEQKQQA
jgi:hypothetical protein